MQCMRVQAEQSQPVSQEAVVSYAKELQDIDPDYRPPINIPDVLRWACSFIYLGCATPVVMARCKSAVCIPVVTGTFP